MVIIVGAGVAGLACARELHRRNVPTVTLERGRRVGGRCASGRVDDQAVDHGTPFLHAISREFGLVLNDLDPAGKLPGWPLRIRGERLAVTPDSYRPGRRRMARRDGVGALPQFLARELDVRFGHEVTALEEAGACVHARLADGTALAAPIVVVAATLPESLALAKPLVHEWPGAGAPLAAIARMRTIPCLTVVAGYPRRGESLEFDIWHPIEATTIHAIVNDSDKREAPRECVLVIHARAQYSASHLEDAEEEWSGELLWEAAELLGHWAKSPLWQQTHRWPCARLRQGDGLGAPVSFESRRGASVAVCGEGFALDGGLEGAYFSGLALGEQIATLPRVRRAVADA